MSLLEAPYQIEVHPKGYASCHKLVAPPQNISAPVNMLAPGTSNTNFKESIHKYIIKKSYVLLYCWWLVEGTDFVA